MTVLRIQRRLRVSATLVLAGLMIALLTFTWSHPTAFLFFAFLGGGVTFAGVLTYLWTLFRWYHPHADETIDLVDEQEVPELMARTAS